MGGPRSRGSRPRGHRHRPELRARVRRPAPARSRPTGVVPGPSPRRACSAPTAPPIASPPQRHVRGRWLVRDAVVRTRTRSISLVRALLRQQGYRVPSGSAENCVDRVQGLPLPGCLLSVVAPLRALMRPLNRPLSYSDERSSTSPSRIRACAAPALGPLRRPCHRHRHPRRHRRRRALPPRASTRSLSRPRASRVQLGRDPPPRPHHQGRPLPRALAADSGRRLDPAPPLPAGGGARTWACVSERAAGNRWPSSRAPGASPASATRCCAMAACSIRSAFGLRVRRPPPS